MLKTLDQERHDKYRKTYRLNFPKDLDEDRVSAWIRAVSGTLRSGGPLAGGVPTVVFELWATSQGITHRLKVPWQHADYVIAQLRSLVPGIRVTPEDEQHRRVWVKSVEVGMTTRSRQLRIYSTADMATSLLASVQALSDDETVLVQWVTSPARPSHKPIMNVARSHELNIRTIAVDGMANRDEVNDRRAKLEEPNMLAVLRVASVANTPGRADHLIDNVRKSLKAIHGPSTKFVRRFVSHAELQRRLDKAHGSFMFPIQLSVPELAALIAWPIGNPLVSGLPPAMARHLPANEQVPRVGRVIGHSNMPGSERPIAIARVDALKHMHIVGPTGVGKSVLLANMIKQDIDADYGVIVMESKGDLFHKTLDYIPARRRKDVIILDVTDHARPVGFNILTQGNSRVVIDEVTALFDHLYDGTSVWTREVLFHGLRTLALDPMLTFIDLAALLVPGSPEEKYWRDKLIRSIKDRELAQFWQRFENQPRAAQDRIVQPVMDRIWQLNGRPELRNIIGQSKSSFQIADVVSGNKILLINLAGVAPESASLTGTLLMNALWHAVKTNRPSKPNFLYLDEFQNFINLPIAPEEMLTQARGFGLGMILAHQHLSQLPSDLRTAIMANARTKIVFQTSSDDASKMSREFGSSVEEHDFIHLGQFETLARIATGDGISAPVSLTTAAPAKGYGGYRDLKEESRNTYGRTLTEVENEIRARRGATRSSAKRPSIGTQGGWE